MNTIQKSEAIKNGLRKGFHDGSSKMAKRKCYGYKINSDGELEINPDEATVVRWIFEQYLSGDSLGKIAAGLEKQGIPSPTGRPKWNREAIDKLLSNEKYTGRVLLQKTVSTELEEQTSSIELQVRHYSQLISKISPGFTNCQRIFFDLFYGSEWGITCPQLGPWPAGSPSDR